MIDFLKSIKKTNLTAIGGYLLLALVIIQNKGLFPEGWKAWVDVAIEYGTYCGLGGMAVGLGDKYRKGEAIVKEKVK